MTIIGWIVLGGLAGWVASMFTDTNAEMGVFANILAGVIGAFVGGFLVNLIGGTGLTGFSIWSFVIATVGAIVSITAYKAVAR